MVVRHHRTIHRVDWQWFVREKKKVFDTSSIPCLIKTKKSIFFLTSWQLIKKPSHINCLSSLFLNKVGWSKKNNNAEVDYPPLLWCRQNQRLADVVEFIMWAGVLVELLQCHGVRSGVFLAAGFGIILGCGARGEGGRAGARAVLAVGPAGGQRGVPAATVSAGRVSPAAPFLHRRLEPEIGRLERGESFFKAQNHNQCDHF